ncbi:unnamed protein product [Symbiodinium natans]|uniref:Uncharacterized protein n=1 Tax=Symbiodinium natans TaxID=878477 RepID=A0A812NY06_9DINO|nr:unnamed protein product [Symbiodinium natans]
MMQKPWSAPPDECAEDAGAAEPEPAFSHHDLLCKDIYAKSSKNLERLGRFMESREVRDKERANWSRNRYRHQIASAQLWAGLHECASHLKPQPLELPPLDPHAFNPWEPEVDTPSGHAGHTGPTFGAPARPTLVRKARGLFSPYASMGDLAAAFHAPEDGGRSAARAPLTKSETDLRPTPGRRPRGLMKGGPKQEIVWPGGWIPKQAVGSRGLPQGFITAKAFPGGVVMYPKDRWFPPEKTAPSS